MYYKDVLNVLERKRVALPMSGLLKNGIAEKNFTESGGCRSGWTPSTSTYCLSIKNTNCRDVRSILNYFPHQEADEELFTSGSAFNFEAPVASPRMTRARRASMSFDAVSF